MSHSPTPRPLAEGRPETRDLDWRRGFEHAATGLDCAECGARVGVRPDLTERHRRWHRELISLLGPPTW